MFNIQLEFKVHSKFAVSSQGGLVVLTV